jgi:hypothetical protein
MLETLRGQLALKSFNIRPIEVRERYAPRLPLRPGARPVDQDAKDPGPQRAATLEDLQPALGCEFGQGFYFATPVEAEAAAELLTGQGRDVFDQPA